MEIPSLHDPQQLAAFYRDALLQDVVPFWLRHGLDHEQGGILTSLDRAGAVIDTDKSIWFQGRAAWMFATLYNHVEPHAAWLSAAQSCLDFLERHAVGDDGKLYFSVTREGRPLRMRRYVYSESFAAIAAAALFRATGSERARASALRYWQNYLRYSFDPALAAPKTDPQTRPMRGIGPLMIAMVTAQELRLNLGEVVALGRTPTEWIAWCVDEIERYFMKPERQVLLETVGIQGEVLDHFDGRLLNPGHAIECAWFLLLESSIVRSPRMEQLGLQILDWMLARGWDHEFGGLYYFRDLDDKPIQEYWHDMKFWWPHCEAIIATLLAWRLTGSERYATLHQQVHDWSFRHFPDPEQGEWFGYLHRDGTVSTTLKGNLWKGPFHLPRMLLWSWKLLDTEPTSLLALSSLPPRRPD